MPTLSRYFIRTALVYLALGFTFGGLMLANKGVPLHPWLWRLLPAHMEFLLVGWTLQLAMGVAFWILPRWWQGPSRGNERGARIAFGLLNVGVLLVAAGGITGAKTAVMVLGRLAEITAVIAFTHHAWFRVVGREG